VLHVLKELGVGSDGFQVETEAGDHVGGQRLEDQVVGKADSGEGDHLDVFLEKLELVLSVARGGDARDALDEDLNDRGRHRQIRGDFFLRVQETSDLLGLLNGELLSVLENEDQDGDED